MSGTKGHWRIVECALTPLRMPKPHFGTCLALGEGDAGRCLTKLSQQHRDIIDLVYSDCDSTLVWERKRSTIELTKGRTAGDVTSAGDSPWRAVSPNRSLTGVPIIACDHRCEGSTTSMPASSKCFTLCVANAARRASAMPAIILSLRSRGSPRRCRELIRTAVS